MPVHGQPCMLPDIHQPGGLPATVPPVPVVPAVPVVPPRPPVPVVPAVAVVPAVPVVPPRPAAPLVPAAPVVPAVPAVVMQMPPMQLPFVHGWLQPPQCVLLVFVSTHAEPQSIWPAAAQPQLPLTQAVAPDGQALQPPEWAVVPSPVDGTQAPPVHMIWPPGHIAMQVVPLQTCPPEHTIVQLPQCCASEGTHDPEQSISPATHWHIPLLQVRLAPQGFPQAPQFWLSVATVLHWPLQFIWPAKQVTEEPPPPPVPLVPPAPMGSPPVGFAQLAASSRQPKATVRRAERDRVFIDLPRR